MKNVMKYKKVFVLGGTTEGREILKFLEEQKIAVIVSVATSYGEELLEIDKTSKSEILQERLDEEGFIQLFEKEEFDLVVDASHPYAKEATQNCYGACLRKGLPYRRILRDSLEVPLEPGEDGVCCIYFDKIEEIVAYLEHTKGNVLLTTGSKDLEVYSKLTHFEKRLYIRMLPSPKMLQEQLDKGYLMSHFICMQGPFSEEINQAMLKHVQAKYMVTKDSGQVGGTCEKLRAARALGVTVLCLRRPMKEEGITLQAFYKEIEEVEDGHKY